MVREGFAGASSPGRLERVRTAPTILLDAAHNPHGMTATLTALREEFSFSRLIVVLAVLADKDVTGMLELLEPVTDALVCTRNTSPRAMSADRLADLAEEVFGEDGSRPSRSCPTRSRPRWRWPSPMWRAATPAWASSSPAPSSRWPRPVTLLVASDADERAAGEALRAA